MNWIFANAGSKCTARQPSHATAALTSRSTLSRKQTSSSQRGKGTPTKGAGASLSSMAPTGPYLNPLRSWRSAFPLFVCLCLYVGYCRSLVYFPSLAPCVRRSLANSIVRHAIEKILTLIDLPDRSPDGPRLAASRTRSDGTRPAWC